MEVQKTLYDRFRTSARGSVGTLDPKLRRYFREYQREFSGRSSASTLGELTEAYLESDLLICGDYHTLHQAQRTALRLLRSTEGALRARGRQPALALEMLRPSDSRATEDFLAGRISEKHFLKSVEWGRRWNFAWENYRPLFDFARDHGVRILGIAPSKPSSLGERDRFAGTVLVRALAQDPTLCVLALVGDLHLAKNHLPFEVRQIALRAKHRLRLTVVHQNAERLYWKAAEQGLGAEASVLRLRSGVFCVLNAPPWAKLQSYLNWVDASSDKTAETIPASDHTEDFLDLARRVQRVLELEDSVSENFALYWKNEPGLWAKQSTERKICEMLDGYFRPSDRAVILGSANVNNVGAQASVYLHADITQRRWAYSQPGRHFYPAVWVEALGYFGSKILNPHRKCSGPSELAGNPDPVAQEVLRHWEMEKKGGRWRLPLRATSSKAVFYYRVAQLLGRWLGESLYRHLANGRLKPSEIGKLFLTPWNDAAQAREAYLFWRRKAR
ncbi:ChaN family lipoprotein [bacterium]|nr:ChaN family lipoprotein [bacterium]